MTKMTEWQNDKMTKKWKKKTKMTIIDKNDKKWHKKTKNDKKWQKMTKKTKND